MAKGLDCIAWIMFFSMLSLILIPVFGSLVSSEIANRVHQTGDVIIASFAACGVLVGWIKSLEQWSLNKEK